jgi:hypothetical protein
MFRKLRKPPAEKLGCGDVSEDGVFGQDQPPGCQIYFGPIASIPR